MNLDLKDFAQSVDSIRNTRIMSEAEKAEIVIHSPFRDGAHIYMYRMILGLPQKTLASESGVSWELIRRVESKGSPIKRCHQEALEKHLTRQKNAEAILQTLIKTDGKEWLSWLVKTVGYRPKISQISCSKCNSTNISFITKNKFKTLVKTTCNDCDYIRYSANLLLVRTQKWRTEPTIDVYEESLFRHVDSKPNGQITIDSNSYELTPELIKAVRLSVGLSQKELSEISPFSRDILRRCEMGSRQIDTNISGMFGELLEKNTHLKDVFVQLHSVPRQKIEATLTSTAKSVAKEKLNQLTIQRS